MMIAGRDFLEKRQKFFLEDKLYSFCSSVAEYGVFSEETPYFKEQKDKIANSRYYSTVRASTVFSMMRMQIASVQQETVQIKVTSLSQINAGEVSGSYYIVRNQMPSAVLSWV